MPDMETLLSDRHRQTTCFIVEGGRSYLHPAALISTKGALTSAHICAGKLTVRAPVVKYLEAYTHREDQHVVTPFQYITTSFMGKEGKRGVHFVSLFASSLLGLVKIHVLFLHQYIIPTLTIKQLNIKQV